MHRRFVTVGEALISLDAEPGVRMEDAPRLAVHVVGAELNFAIALRRLGVPTAFFGAVGSDPWGRKIRRVALGEGVDIEGVVTDPHRPTALLFKEALGWEDTARVYYRRQGCAGSAFRATPALLEAAQSAMGMHVSGISLCLSDSLRQACLTALEALPPGALRTFDLNVRLRLAPPEVWARILLDMASRVDILFVSASELKAIGLSPSTLEKAMEGGPGYAVVRRGKEPTLVVASGEKWEVAQPLGSVRVMDVVGAGDAFAAAVVALRLEGRPWEEAVRAGHFAGSQVVSVQGDFEGAPYREELAAFLADRSVDR